MRETVDARRQRLGRDEALRLVRSARRLWVARGRRLLEHAVGPDEPGDEDLSKLVLGRSGTLRAPTIRVGDTLVVGFSADAYARLFEQDTASDTTSAQKEA